jgi:catechol 2,3-dioxygenase-like lactoylglutathione lyase family enzyme
MKTHISLDTQDLNASIAFYRTLLDSEPAKSHDDYALFVTDDPGLELALTRAPQVRAVSNSSIHYGIAVDKPGLVKVAIKRLRDAGLTVDIELGETCCYAVQDKVWATDPDGRRWETYYVIAETDEREGENMTCCHEPNDEPATCCSI